MGLTSWAKSPNGKILKSDVVVTKNYLSEEELKSLGRIVNTYLDLAEERANRKIPMTMQDWIDRLDKFLEFDEREILTDGGKISAKIAQEFAESEWEKYRITQDKLFDSDLDKILPYIEFSLSQKEIGYINFHYSVKGFGIYEIIRLDAAPITQEYITKFQNIGGINIK